MGGIEWSNSVLKNTHDLFSDVGGALSNTSITKFSVSNEVVSPLCFSLFEKMLKT
jgi:hypothetical protein